MLNIVGKNLKNPHKKYEKNIKNKNKKYIVEGVELDRVERAEKLDHVTALRVKAPKRRPPSSIFLKDNVSDRSFFLSFSSTNYLATIFCLDFCFCIFLNFFNAYFFTFLLHIS